MQTDVKATAPLTATGTFTTTTTQNMSFRTRLKAIYAVCGATAGSVVFNSGTETLFTLNTPASGAGTSTIYLILPGEGFLAENGLAGVVTNTSSVVAFYG